MEDEEYTCDIETIELKNLILVWLTECENYLKNRDLSYTRPSPLLSRTVLVWFTFTYKLLFVLFHGFPF